jgi:Tol biopolymer transport system component
MGRLPWPRALLATLLALSLAGAGAVHGAGSSHASASGLIVFASDRDKANPGEIYSLAPGSAPRDVSRSLADDYGLAVAPVGDLIAFWSGRSGVDRVYLARSDGSHLRLVRGQGPGLAGSNGGGGAPLVFSADGSRLFASYSVFHLPRTNKAYAFAIDPRSATAHPLHGCYGARPSPDGALEACGAPGKTSVYDLAGHLRFSLPGFNPLWSRLGLLTSTPGADTAAPTRIVDSSGASRGIVNGQPLAWSPDGRWLAFAHGQDLWIAGGSDFSHTRLLLAGWGGTLAFTPDSRFISTQAQPGRLVLVPVAGGRPAKGLDGGLGVWSRSGRLAYAGFPVVYSKPAEPGVMLPVFVTDTHGRNPRIVGRFPFDDHAFEILQWLPDGKRVLFLTATNCGGKGLYAVSASGGVAQRLNHDPSAVEAPAWSHDGTRIAYSVQKFACHLGAGEPIHIATVAADGSDPQRVTDDGDSQTGSFDADPSFSPDGRSIAFSAGTFDSSTLQIIALGGGARTPLLPAAGGGPSNPAWSPDGSKIAYVAAGASIMVVGATGGTPELVATIPPRKLCNAGGLAWSPDGTQLALPGDAGIYLIALGSAPPTAQLAIRVRCAEYPSFSPDGTQIAFDAPAAHPLGVQTAIMAANIDGTGIRTLSTVPFRQSVHPTWQPAP